VPGRCLCRPGLRHVNGVPGGDSGSGVEQGSGIEDLDDGKVGMADAVSATGTELVNEGGELAGPGRVEGLQQPPVADGR
jgi:hypothetical protein